MTDAWKITLPCTREDAESLQGDQPWLDGFSPTPVIIATEPDPAQPEDWRLDIYTEGEPPAALIAAVQALLPDADAIVTERLEMQDWVTLSQSGLEPITAGRFFVHTAADAELLPDGSIPLQIEAGLAFGTGQHATTTGCLQEIDALDLEPRNVLDVGTGTAILALAMNKRWPKARVTASDIDPISITVSEENIAINGGSVGTGPGEVALFVADGVAHQPIVSRAPYDLVVANILAGPLIALARDIADVMAPGATLILAGVLADQADGVEAAYREFGVTPRSRRPIGDWPTLLLHKH